MNPPKIIFFDAAGTLLHLPKGVGHHYSLVASRHGLHCDEQTLNRAFAQAWKSIPAPVTTKAPRPDDDRAWWRTLVWQVLDTLPPAQTFDRETFFTDLYQHFAEPGVWSLYPEVPEVLTRLHRHYRLGIISNFDARLRTLLTQFNIFHLFEVVAISSEIGADKPDPYIFEQALHLAAVLPQEALHIGDDPIHDWQAATTAGLQTFHLDRPKNSLLDIPEFLKLAAVQTPKFP